MKTKQNINSTAVLLALTILGLFCGCDLEEIPDEPSNGLIEITIKVNMTDAEEFTAGIDEVYISGDFTDPAWEEPGLNSPYQLSPTIENPLVFEITLEFDEPNDIVYKLYIFPPNTPIGSGFNYGEWQGLPNRSLSVETTKTVSFPWASCPGIPTITDIDENVYNTVQIGEQCWFKENLNVGALITTETNQKKNDTIEKYCLHNSLWSCGQYGGLYQWDELMQYSTNGGVKGICPQGWHIPTDEEWCTMTQHIDQEVVCDTNSWSGDFISEKMKSKDDWNGTNTSGFSALAAGYYSSVQGTFIGEGLSTNFWTSTENGSLAWKRTLKSDDVGIYRDKSAKASGFSVRCIKD